MEEIHLCDYGCGQITIKRFGNGKWCCSSHSNKCPSLKNKISEKAKFEQIETSEFCSYGCGKQANYKLKNKFCCSDHWTKCKTRKIITSDYMKEKFLEIKTEELCFHGCGKQAKYIAKNGNYCCGDRSNKCQVVKDKDAESKINKPRSEETRLKIKIALDNDEIRLKISTTSRQRMLNGGAARAQSFIQNPSKPQVSLYNIIKDLYPSTILQFSMRDFGLNYCLDICIPEYKIAIEYDGHYWHNGKEEQDLKRQLQCEKFGFVFLRYKGTEKKEVVPNKNIVEKDIICIISNFYKD